MSNSFLSRTPGSTTDAQRKQFTISVWLKRSDLLTGSNHQEVLSAFATDQFGFRFQGDNKLDIFDYSVSGNNYPLRLVTNRLFRDTSAWYHIVLQVDTPNSTSSDRVKLWVNGVQETSFETANYPSQDYTASWNKNGLHQIGSKAWGNSGNGSDMFPGYLAHVANVAGSVVAPTVFGGTDSTSGIWKFKIPSGVTWGTNGFHLKFENSANLGLDSANSNNFTVNGDLKQSIDTPSIVYPTLNRIANTNTNSTISDGALTHTVSGQWLGAISSFGVTSGKWYAEAKITDEQNFSIGFATLVGSFVKDMNTANSGYVGKGNDSWGFWGNGAGNAQKTHNNSSSNYGSAFSTNDIMILAMDVDNKKLYFGKNGTFFDSSNPATQANPAYTFTTTEPMGFASGPENGAVQWNFGAGNFGDTPITSAGSNGNGSLFEYDVPSGFYALNTKNINTYG